MLFVSSSVKIARLCREDVGFNLGIEMLFVSSEGVACMTSQNYSSFNLGIEMLFVSRLSDYEVSSDDGSTWFQSRNRDAFRFKQPPPKGWGLFV